MAADPDEEALSWSGETDPTHVAAPVPGKAQRQLADGLDDRADAANPVLLVVMGIIAGVYLLYAAGWGIHAFTHAVPPGVSGAFAAIMFQLGEFFSIASPILWAGTVWLVVKRPGWRLLWLFVGVIVLVPLPFILGM